MMCKGELLRVSHTTSNVTLTELACSSPTYSTSSSNDSSHISKIKDMTSNLSYRYGLPRRRCHLHSSLSRSVISVSATSTTLRNSSFLPTRQGFCHELSSWGADREEGGGEGTNTIHRATSNLLRVLRRPKASDHTRLALEMRGSSSCLTDD
ncbi:uncharacterized protein LY79DRAFT_556055, partial [Colletotrichum navitas]